MKDTNRYSVLYKTNIALVINKKDIIKISSSDIVSISIVNNYDTMTYPIIRLRLYSDISLIEKISENYNDIYVRGNLDGGVYRMNDDDKTPVLISPTKGISIKMKAYIENKNTPTSSMDQYEDGIKKNNDLNENVKVPIELYCYDDSLIHNMKQKSQSIYKSMSLTSIIEDMFRRSEILQYEIDPLDNQNKFNQVLIPNLNILKSLSFLETNYGLHKKGSQIFGDIDKFYLCSMDVNNNTKPLPIYVDSYKSNSDMGGMRRFSNNFNMNIKASNVSVMSQTDIERIMNSQEMVVVDLNNLRVDTNRLQKLYAVHGVDKTSENISTPNILHKTKNEYITDFNIARINEKITRVDVSGVGFDISKMKINTRYNLIFESPIRGMSMNEYYRPTYACHVLSNLDSDLFVSQTTMNLCSN